MATLQPAARRGVLRGPASSSRLRDTPIARRGWRLPRLPLLALALLSLALLGVLQVLQSSHLASTGYRVRALEQERTALAAEVRLLEAEVAQRANLDRIHADAVERLGMVPSEESVTVRVDVAAPAGMPLPRRYVAAPEPVSQPEEPRWHQVLSWLPGLR